MKRFILMICAVAALVCSCDKYGDTIEDLAKRADGISATSAMLLSKVEALQVLADAKDAQTTISSITNEAEGLKVCFSDGSQYIITDGAAGADGADGKPGAAGPDGQDKIKVTETDIDYTFDFGNGSVITVAKTFMLDLEDSFEAPAGSDVEIEYEVIADDGSVHVLAKSNDGCKIVSIDEEAGVIVVKASGRQGEHHVIVSAIRNSDGKVNEKVVSIVSGPRAPIALDGASAGDYGDYYESGTNDYFTQFYKGEVDENNYFVGEAYSLIFDFLGPATDVLSSLPEGIFEASDTYEPFTFEMGVGMTLLEELEESFWIYQLFYGYSTIDELIADLGLTEEELNAVSYASGAELYHQYEDETYDDLPITEGTVELTLTGADTYSVVMNLVAGGEDWTFTYEGTIPVEDHRPVVTDDEGYDVCTMVNEGGVYENGTTAFFLTFTSSTGDLDPIEMELFAPEGLSLVPAGEYEVSYSYDPFTIGYCCCEDGSMYGLFADTGTMTVKCDDNGVYAIKGSFSDEYVGQLWDFSFNGMMSEDISGDFEAPAKNIRNDREIVLNERGTVKPSPRIRMQQINEAKAKMEGKAPKTPFFLHK